MNRYNYWTVPADPISMHEIEAMYIKQARTCPECKRSYYSLHPKSGCKYGTVERVTES